jgi:hypothetical protein
LSEFSSEDHVYDSLFGQEVFCSTENGKEWLERDRSGFFGTQANPQNRSVSAAVIFPAADPWHFPKSVPVFVANPWARFPVNQPLGECLGFCWTDGGLVQCTKKMSCEEFFGLPSNWFEDEAARIDDV